MNDEKIAEKAEDLADKKSDNTTSSGDYWRSVVKEAVLLARPLEVLPGKRWAWKGKKELK